MNHANRDNLINNKSTDITFRLMESYKYTVDGVDYEVRIEAVDNDEAAVQVNGKLFTVKLNEHLRPMRPHRVQVTPPKAVDSDASVYKADAVTAQDTATLEGEKVYAPLPGTVTDIRVNVGDTVKAGQAVIVLEAMKMQNNITADVAGRVTAILVKPGDTVMEGAALITIG